MRHFLSTGVMVLAAGMAAAAVAAGGRPQVLDTRAGLINYVEGVVTIDEQLIVLPPPEQFFAMKLGVREGKTLATGENGRAELLLSAGVTLRLGAESSIKMLRSDPENTRVRLDRGSAVVEVIEKIESNLVAIQANGVDVTFTKAGTYAFTLPHLLVYRGKAEIGAATGAKRITISAGQTAALNAPAGPLAIRRFDNKRQRQDELLVWSIGRSQRMAQANLTAATAFARPAMGGWIWNHYASCYTYLPARYRRCDDFTDTCFYSRYELPPIPPGHTQINIVTPDPPERYTPPTYSYDSNRGYIVADGNRSPGGIPPTANPTQPPVADSGNGRSGADSGGRGAEGGTRAK